MQLIGINSCDRLPAFRGHEELFPRVKRHELFRGTDAIFGASFCKTSADNGNELPVSDALFCYTTGYQYDDVSTSRSPSWFSSA